MRKSTSNILVDTPSWCAGVLDGCGRFHLSRSGDRWYWRVSIVTDVRTAAKFARLTGVTMRQQRAGTWTATGPAVIPLLAQVIPRMFCLHEEAGVVYRYLLTRPGRTGMRKSMTNAVIKYREEMIAKLAASKATR